MKPVPLSTSPFSASKLTINHNTITVADSIYHDQPHHGYPCSNPLLAPKASSRPEPNRRVHAVIPKPRPCLNHGSIVVEPRQNPSLCAVAPSRRSLLTATAAIESIRRRLHNPQASPRPLLCHASTDQIFTTTEEQNATVRASLKPCDATWKKKPKEELDRTTRKKSRSTEEEETNRKELTSLCSAAP
ncbi:hypothetical protein M0R45_009097 [Rubus argutus]|uniref:Uncharacterized protein n=1 Tax=Rubus argutus TaxID=59490 RepID=A0AAW1Y374_RUBAR